MLTLPTIPPIPILVGVTLLVMAYAAALGAFMRSKESGRLNPILIAALVQLVLGGAVALSGILQPTPTRPPLLVLLVFPSILIGAFVLPAVPSFRRAIDALPPAALYLPHVSRIFFGAALLGLAVREGLPWEFAEPVGVGDIVAGFGALLVFLAFRAQQGWARPAAWVWNLFGMLDFLQAFTIGALAASGPQHRLTTTPTTDALTMFPISLIPTFAVVTLFVLHAWSVRSLLRRPETATEVVRDRTGVVAI